MCSLSPLIATHWAGRTVPYLFYEAQAAPFMTLEQDQCFCVAQVRD